MARGRLVQNAKFNDTRPVTIGRSESNKNSDGDKIEILMYPVGAAAPPVQKKGTEKRGSSFPMARKKVMTARSKLDWLCRASTSTVLLL